MQSQAWCNLALVLLGCFVLALYYGWNSPETQPTCPYVWNGGSPLKDDGSCWCGSDKYCLCTPSLAIEVIILINPERAPGDETVVAKEDDSILLVYRKHPPEMYAIPGGFVEVGETVEQTAVREIKEELNLDIDKSQLSLFGVYSDPSRDKRRHTASAVFLCTLSAVGHKGQLNLLRGGDDAKSVRKIPLMEAFDLSLAFDHRRMLMDLVAQKYS